MAKVIGVRFRETGKIYYFDPNGVEIAMNDYVLVETARGRELGQVRMAPREIPDDELNNPLKPITRKADEDDVARMRSNREKEKEAFKICKRKIREHGLEMKLVDAEYTFDNNKLLFYFTADGRVDFRELVKDLAGTFHIRIELRQIGVRDETRIMGGLGPCGRELCCKSWLTDFVPVSIKMAKEQNLSLNPTKISGVCGRLMCCLKNEQESYEYLNAQMPRVGARITTPDGMEGRVTNVNVLRQVIKVVVENNDEKEMREYTADELAGKPKAEEESRSEGGRSQGGQKAHDGQKRSEGRKRQDNHKNQKGEQNDRSDRNDRSDKGGKNRNDGENNRNRNDRGNRNNRNDRNDKNDRGDRNNDRNDRNKNRNQGEGKNQNRNNQNRKNNQNRDGQNKENQNKDGQNKGNQNNPNKGGQNKNHRSNNRNRKNNRNDSQNQGQNPSQTQSQPQSQGQNQSQAQSQPQTQGHVRGGYSSGYASDQPKE